MVDKNESDSDESQDIEDDNDDDGLFGGDDQLDDESGDSDDDVEEQPKNGNNKRPLPATEDAIGTSKKKLKKELFKPPTAEEMTHLRETENLFHSNLFRLEIEEMMKEIQIKDKYKKKFHAWFAEFHAFVMTMKQSKEMPMSDISWLKKHKITLPISLDLPKFVSNFQFLKPSSVSVVGSFAAECRLAPEIEIDIKIEIPKATFVRADHQNMKYFLKRALYLCHIASKLKNSTLADDLEFALLEGDSWKPVLTIKCAEKLGKHIRVRILCVPESDSFKMSQLSPEKNNVKTKWVTGEDDEGLLVPTQFYNRSVAVDAALAANEQWRQEVLENKKALAEGIMLLKVWLRQRGLDKGYGAFTGFIVSMYVAHLTKERKLSGVMSSYQVVRNTWNSLAREDWTMNGISLSPKKTNPSIDDFHLLYDVVFVDSTGYMNICGNMSKSTFQHVKRESALALKCLDNHNINSFSALFMTKMPFYRQFDHIINLDHAAVEKAKKHLDAPAQLDASGPWLTHQSIVSLLGQALDQRVHLISVQLQPSVEWSVEEQPPNAHERPLVLGLALNPEHALALLTKGPSANLAEAKVFRDFWGDKSELRRFQDGSVCEAVVWSGGGMARRRLICRDVVRHVVQRHLGLGAEDVGYIADQFECVLENSVGEEGSLACTKACDELGRQLMHLEGLPLSIASYQGSSPILRYSDPFPPTPYKAPRSKFPSSTVALQAGDNTPRYISPIPVILTLALSSKWPDDLEAIKRIRAAFFVKLSEVLKQQLHLVSQPYPSYIDVLKNGYVFRLMIYHAREISLLKETTTTQGLLKYKDNEESINLELCYSHLPALTSVLHGLHLTHPSLGPASCLAKRWVASHLLLDDTLMPETCVELLMSSIYLTPEPFQMPVQPQTAFLRFLQLLANAPWKSEPLILNFRDELKRPEIVEIENKFNSERSTLPPLFIVTPEARSGTVWTKHAPSNQILFRLTQLATASLQTLDSELLSNENFDFKVIFRTPMEIFDVVINLKDNLIRKNESLDAVSALKPSDSQIDSADRIPVVNLDFAQCFLQDLRESYADAALFFHDRHGGSQIGVLFKPNAMQAQELKVAHMNGHVPRPPKQMALSKELFVEDVKTLGEGIVKSVSVK